MENFERNFENLKFYLFAWATEGLVNKYVKFISNPFVNPPFVEADFKKLIRYKRNLRKLDQKWGFIKENFGPDSEFMKHFDNVCIIIYNSLNNEE